MGMLPFITYAAVAGVAGLANPIPVPGEAGYTPDAHNFVRGMFENDSASGRDRNYTHGTRLDYAHVMRNGHAWGLSLTQNIYTPETHTHGRVESEHPYCGYAAIGGAYLWRGVDFGCATELQVGMTGKASCAGRVQNLLHDTMKISEWDGWDDQIPSEVTLQLTSRQVWRLRSLELNKGEWQTDGVAYLRESVGTFRVSGGVGFSVRLGYNLPSTMPEVGNEATSYGVGVIKRPSYRRDDLSYYVTFGAWVDYVARDLTVDGGVFHHFDRSCSRTPWQANGHMGLGISYHGIDYYAGVRLMSRTYRTQDENSLLGVFSITWSW